MDKGKELIVTATEYFGQEFTLLLLVQLHKDGLGFGNVVETTFVKPARCRRMVPHGKIYIR